MNHLENFREKLAVDLVVSFDEDLSQTALTNWIVFSVEFVKPEGKPEMINSGKSLSSSMNDELMIVAANISLDHKYLEPTAAAVRLNQDH